MKSTNDKLTTVKPFQFDEVRERTRAQRRAILREIILNKLHGDPQKQFIASQTLLQIPQEDQTAFIEDTEEDLKYMDQSRIAGLNVTAAELIQWQNALSP